jgi:hypothetical protein
MEAEVVVAVLLVLLVVVLVVVVVVVGGGGGGWVCMCWRTRVHKLGVGNSPRQLHHWVT